MSKKLIAVASAAALALSALVGLPANASGFATQLSEIDYDGGGNFFETNSGYDFEITDGNGLTARTPAKVDVPSSTVLRDDEDQGLMVVVTTTATRAFTVSTTANVHVALLSDYEELVAEADSGYVAVKDLKTGDNAISTSSASGSLSAAFVAFTTSTATGEITIRNGGNAKTYFIKGENEYAYTIDFSAPTTIANGSEVEITGTIKDLWGNAITGTSGDFSSSDLEASGLPSISYDTEYDSTSSKWVITFDASSSASTQAVEVTIDSDYRSSRVTGYAAPKLSQFFSWNLQDLAGTVAALQAQVAALEEIVDRKVTKKRYNKLARKWNAAFPGQAVKLKK